MDLSAPGKRKAKADEGPGESVLDAVLEDLAELDPPTEAQGSDTGAK